MRMRLLDRYLLRELVMPLAVCLGGFLLFYISFDLIGSLNKFQEHHLNAGDVLQLYLVKIPEILVFILPIVLLLALLYALTNHARNNEIMAMRAAGVSLWRISAVYLAVGLVFSLAVFFMNEQWVPASKARQEAIMTRHEKHATAPELNVQYNFFYANSRDQRKWLVGVCDFDSQVLRNPQVYWKEKGADWHLIAHRAEVVEGSWVFYGLTSFATNDITSLAEMVFTLKKPDSNMAQYLKSVLSPETQTLVARYVGGENEELRRLLTEDFNHLIRHGQLYDPRRFYGVKLSPETINLIASKPAGGTDLLELNFLLLADAFPSGISRKAAYEVLLYKGDAGKGQQVMPYLRTNRLVMPAFTETMQDFSTEVEFNNHFISSFNTETVEVPTLDLLRYLRAHPELIGKNRAVLRTQMHGRIALPWTCLVVVLIAIPFGALGGRRNIFAGVAGSILICFVYFVLLKTSLALGTAGVLPGWMAAWLPNGFFGFLGYSLISRVL